MRTHARFLFTLAFGCLTAATVSAQVASGPGRNLTPDLKSQQLWTRVGANGTKVTYTSVAGVSDGTSTWADVWMVNPDGTGRFRVPAKLKASEEAGVVSPDGTKVLLHAFGSVTANAAGPTDIWVYDLVTGRSVAVTTHPAYDAYPQWHPDGRHIAFLSQRNTSASTSYNIFMMQAVDANGNITPENTTDNVPVQLTNFKTYGSVTGIANRQTFSPDGSKIIFIGMGQTPDGKQYANYEIFVADTVDTNGDLFADNMVRVTNRDIMKNGAAVSIFDPFMVEPNGRIFFYAALSPDNKNHVLSLDPWPAIQNPGDPSKLNNDVWQVTAASFSEEYPNATGALMVVSASGDDNRNAAGIGVDNRDVVVYDLVADTGPGSVSGVLTGPLGEPMPGYTIRIFNGFTLKGETVTDAQGAFAFSDLRAGGYILSLVADPLHPRPMFAVTRGVIVAPGKNTVQDIWSTPQAARRPLGVIPTIRDGKVSVVWAQDTAALQAGFTYEGFNVWKGATASGPWTKLNASLIPVSNRYEFVDETPGDLYNAFYTVTSVTTDGFSSVESTWADTGQAANNLLFNPSYEQTDNTGRPVGWVAVLSAAGQDSTIGVDPSDAILGGQSLYHQAGATATGDIYAHTDVPYFPPVKGSENYIHSVYARFKGVNSNAVKSNTRLAGSVTDPNAGAPWWFPAGFNAFNPLTSPGAANPNTPWTLQFQNYTLGIWEFTTYARFSTQATFDAASVGTGARVLYDDARFQVLRVGPTGNIWGRVVNSAGVGVSGALATGGGVSTYSFPNGVFVLRNVPTGPVDVSVSYPGQTTVNASIENVGGYRFPTDIVYTGNIQPFVKGRIRLPGGLPAAGATVRMVVGKNSQTMEKTYTATTDANGEYELDLQSDPPDLAQHAWVVASLGGYQSALALDKVFGVGTTRFDLTLGPAVPEIQIARAASAISVDGQANEAAWNGAQVVPLSFLYPGATAPAVPATARLLWDNDNLYLAFTAEEPAMAGLKAAAFGFDAVESPNNIFADDHVELLIDPTVSAGVGFGREIWQIGANANTADIGFGDVLLRNAPDVLDLFAGKVENTGMQAAASHTANSWTVEMKIPFAGLSTFDLNVPNPAVGTQWRGLVGRFRSADGQYSSTSLMTAGFVRAELWNTLTFVNAVTAKKGDLTGDNLITNSDAIEALKIAAGLADLGGRLQQGDVADADGQVNIRDAARILRFLQGLDPTFPN